MSAIGCRMLSDAMPTASFLTFAGKKPVAGLLMHAASNQAAAF